MTQHDSPPRTLLEKIWDSHVVHDQPGAPTMLYVDLHLIHEVTSPQAFAGLKLAGRRVRQPGRTVATPDHNVPTTPDRTIEDPVAGKQIQALRDHCREFGITLYDLDDHRQGIVHIVGPELGYTQPGMTIVCGDSHTATHGAFGALAFGIGTSEVEHVLATQTLMQFKPRTFQLVVEGQLQRGVTAKDLVLYLIGQLTTSGGTGYVLEYTGSTIAGLSMEQRMTICNMSIEAGARAGMMAPDETTIEYLRGRPMLPDAFDQAASLWRELRSDPDARYDRSAQYQADRIAPQITWGTNPDQVIGIDQRVPQPGDLDDPAHREHAQRALQYMDLQPGTSLTDVGVDRVFIGSCTNARMEDLRLAAAVARGRRVSDRVQAMVVPGSGLVQAQAEQEGLDRVFREAGFEWRRPGCSMCLAMNADALQPGERCAATSNRNFEGRQGKGGRTHLVSPSMAAGAAIEGRFVDIRQWETQP